MSNVPPPEASSRARVYLSGLKVSAVCVRPFTGGNMQQPKTAFPADLDVQDDDEEPIIALGSSAPRLTAQHRASAQREVEKLVDKLSQDLPLLLNDAGEANMKMNRAPGRCVMQGTGGAVSVSWFPAQFDETSAGELQVIEWRGLVTLPGSAPKPDAKATIVEVSLFHLVRGAGPNEWTWQGDKESKAFETEGLAQRCLERLKTREAKAVKAAAAATR